MANYDAMKECFIRKVAALGGNVDRDLNEFGQNQVVWLNNTYNPSAETGSSCNWNLPSVEACLKFIKDEIRYKTGTGITVKIVRIQDCGDLFRAFSAK